MQLICGYKHLRITDYVSVNITAVRDALQQLYSLHSTSCHHQPTQRCINSKNFPATEGL